MRVGEKWMRWTFAEAGTKTGSKLLQKVIGNLSATVAYTFFATMVVGLVQVIAGFVMAKARAKKILTDWVDISGSCLFGFFAVVSTILGFAVFYLGGDIGVNTFIITLSIIPGALIDRIFFGHKLNIRQWLGLALAILAGYSVLGWPSLQEVLALPLWVWLSVAMAFSVAINQGITQKVRKIDPFVKNFWGGATTLFLAGVGLMVLGSINLLANFSSPMQKLWFVSAAIGIIIVAMWSFNLMSYKGGASIALKKLVMNGTYLSSAMVLGIIIFGEKLTFGKAVGVALYIAAFVLMDKNTWEFCSRLWRRNGVLA